MRKSPGNAVKPLPAGVDASFARYLTNIVTTTFLPPEIFLRFHQSSTLYSFVVFSYLRLKSWPEVSMYVPYNPPLQAWKNIKNCWRHKLFPESRHCRFHNKSLPTPAPVDTNIYGQNKPRTPGILDTTGIPPIDIYNDHWNKEDLFLKDLDPHS